MISEIRKTRFTNREIKVFRAINIFGRVDSAFLRDAFFTQMSKGAAKVGVSRAVKKLEKLNLIVSKDWVNGSKVYGLGKSAKTAIESVFEFKYYGKKGMGYSEMEHDILVAKTYLKWRKAGFVKIHSERMLKTSGAIKGSIPDLLVFDDRGRRIFLEIETSPKTPKRYLKKLYEFNEVENLREVIFYTDDASIKKMLDRAIEMAGNLDFLVSVKDLLEVLGEQ